MEEWPLSPPKRTHSCSPTCQRGDSRHYFTECVEHTAYAACYRTLGFLSRPLPHVPSPTPHVATNMPPAPQAGIGAAFRRLSRRAHSHVVHGVLGSENFCEGGLPSFRFPVRDNAIDFPPFQRHRIVCIIDTDHKFFAGGHITYPNFPGINTTS